MQTVHDRPIPDIPFNGKPAFSLLKKSDTDAPAGKSCARESVGKSAYDMLADDRYTSLNIEIACMPGYQPDETALDQLKNFLSGLLRKPGGITITETHIPTAGKSSLTVTDIVAIEDRDRSAYADGKQLQCF